MSNTFSPTIRWYLKVLAVFLILCVVILWILAFINPKLPPSYKMQTPPAEVMPWKK